MTSLSLSDTDPAELAVDAIIVGLHTVNGEGPLLAPGAESVAVAFEGKLAETFALLGATGAPGEVTKLATLGTVSAPVIAAVGLGPAPADGVTPLDTLRRAAASAVRSLAGATKVTVALPTPDGDDAAATLRGIAEGALLGTYRFAGYKTKPQPGRRNPVKSVSLHVPDASDKAARAEIKRAGVIFAAVARTRDWSTPHPTTCSPRPSRPAPQPGRGRRAAGRGPRRAGARGRAGTAASSGSGAARQRKPRLVTAALVRAAPRASVALSARASRSTPAASRSSPPRTWTT